MALVRRSSAARLVYVNVADSFRLGRRESTLAMVPMRVEEAVMLSRRQMLAAGSGVVAGATLSGCSFFSTDSDDDKSVRRGDSDATESPMLTELVQAGELLRLEQRIPSNPMVLEPLDSTGIYGGTLRRGMTDSNNGAVGIGCIGHAGLVERGLDDSWPHPGLAESWDVEDDGKTFVFQLRKGLHWSDGKPFTTDDLMFVYKHVFLNTTLTPAPWTWLSAGGEPVKFEQVDKSTIRFVFAAPHGLLLKMLCHPYNSLGIIKPAHYLQQFHPDFVSMSSLKKLAKDEGSPGWDDLFASKDDIWLNPDRPVMGPWRMAEPPTPSGNTATVERNPFYWKVDPDGRQLPYIDRISYLFLEREGLSLRAAKGEFDLAGRNMPFDNNKLFVDGEEAGNYKVFRWQTDGMYTALYLNQSHNDPAVRKLFQSRDFRAALSHAINRDEVNEALLVGLGLTDQPCGMPGDDYYVEGMGQTFTSFDVGRANELLDGLDLTSRDGDGYRQLPDGRKLVLRLITLPTDEGLSLIDYYEFVKRYWKEVGIRLDVKMISSELWWERVPTGDYDIAGYLMPGINWDMDGVWYVPTAETTYWAPFFGKWYATEGAEGEEPDGDIRQAQLLWDELKVAIDNRERIGIGRKILELHNKNVWVIGSLRPPFAPLIVNNDLVNVRAEAHLDFRTGDEEATVVEQLYFRNPEDHA